MARLSLSLVSHFLVELKPLPKKYLFHFLFSLKELRSLGSPLRQLGVCLFQLRILPPQCGRIHALATQKLLPAGMAFVQLAAFYLAIFFRYRAATVNADFLFIAFERGIPLIITSVTMIPFQPNFCPLRLIPRGYPNFFYNE